MGWGDGDGALEKAPPLGDSQAAEGTAWYICRWASQFASGNTRGSLVAAISLLSTLGRGECKL